jgi:acyl-[acyl-carrier-protein] desaturase
MGAAVVTDLLLELQPVVEQNLDRHLSVAKEWLPHEYVPWSQGRDFVAEPWEPGDSRLTPEAVAALEINLLTEDNLPSYHHEIAVRFGRDGAWGTWVHRWTAEEGRHAMCLRDYLLVTRGLDPDALERQRMAVMRTGYDSGGKSVPEALAYVSLQELATRVSHRNTGRLIRDPVADRLLARVAADENLHMIFYRRLVSAALEIAPATMVTAIAREIQDFAMPGAGIPGRPGRHLQPAHPLRRDRPAAGAALAAVRAGRSRRPRPRRPGGLPRTARRRGSPPGRQDQHSGQKTTTDQDGIGP